MNASEFVKRRQQEAAQHAAAVEARPFNPAKNAPVVKLARSLYLPTGQFDPTDHDNPTVIDQRRAQAASIATDDSLPRTGDDYLSWVGDLNERAATAQQRRRNREAERVAEWNEVNRIAQFYRERPTFLDWLTYDGRFYARYMAYQLIYHDKADQIDRMERIKQQRRVKRTLLPGIRRMERRAKRRIKAAEREAEKRALQTKRARDKAADAERKRREREAARLKRLRDSATSGRSLTRSLQPFVNECVGMRESEVKRWFDTYQIHPSHWNKAIEMINRATRLASVTAAQSETITH